MAEDRPRGFGGDDDWFEGDDEWVDTSERAALGREAGEGAEEQAAPPPRRARRPLFSRRAQRRTGRSARRSPPATVAADETEERRDDPFTPARVPVPAERRSHRRDLPARVRRRQFGGLAAVALLVIAAIALASSGGDEPAEPPALKRLVGQTIVAPLGKAGPNERLLRLVRRGRIGSVIAFPSDAATLQSSVEQFQQAAEEGGNPPLLVMIDQEGGAVKRLPGPPEISPADLGQSGNADESRAQGEATGEYLADLGVDVDLAPVLDVRAPQTADSIAQRTFGAEPEVVAELGTAFGEGLQSQGVAATGKHFPGLGLATVNPDFGSTSVAASREDREAALEPFRAAIDANFELIMVATAAYPSFGSDRPAALAPPIVNGLLRDQLGFDGVAITDDLEAPGVAEVANPRRAAVGALRAGNDLALYASSPGAAVGGFNAVVAAVKAGTLDRGVIEEAYDRITDLKSRLAG